MLRYLGNRMTRCQHALSRRSPFVATPRPAIGFAILRSERIIEGNDMDEPVLTPKAPGRRYEATAAPRNDQDVATTETRL